MGELASANRIGGESLAKEPPWQARSIIHIKDLFHEGLFIEKTAAHQVGVWIVRFMSALSGRMRSVHHLFQRAVHMLKGRFDGVERFRDV